MAYQARVYGQCNALEQCTAAHPECASSHYFVRPDSHWHHRTPLQPPWPASQEPPHR